MIKMDYFMKNMKKLVYSTFLLIMLSCNSNFDNDSSSGSMRFNLLIDNYEGDTSYDDRITNSTEGFKSASHYVIDENQKIVKDVRILYDTTKSKVVIENLQDGNYSLLLLLHSANNNELVRIHDISNVTDKWLTLSGSNTKPIEDEYFYANHPFTVNNGVISQSDVNLKRIVSRFDFNFNFGNNYVERTVKSIELIPDVGYTANTFHVNNKYTGENVIDAISILDNRSIMIFPKSNNQEFSGKIKITWEPDGDEIVIKEYLFTSPIHPNKLSNINIDVMHPRSTLGMIIVNDVDYNESNFSRILQDGEPKEIYTDNKYRSLNIHKPLQISLTEDNKINLRFYSPIKVKGVKVFAKIKGIEDKIEIFDIESIPNFADIYLTSTLTEKDAIYKTSDGKYIKVKKMVDIKAGDIEFEFESNDLYLEKISQLKPRWFLQFSLYGTNPDIPSGGLGMNGTWIGIRPVHIREAISIFTNAAYMFSTDKFQEVLVNYDGDIKGNDGLPLDKSKILDVFINIGGFTIGLLGRGDAEGLGGGWTFGIKQYVFFGHYNTAAFTDTIFHELSHCAGWSHASEMTYGPFASRIANHHYINNIADFPINSSTYLDSNNNPNIYIY